MHRSILVDHVQFAFRVQKLNRTEKMIIFIVFLVSLKVHAGAAERACNQRPRINDQRVTETCAEWDDEQTGRCARFAYTCDDSWAMKPGVVNGDGATVTFSFLSCMASKAGEGKLVQLALLYC